MKFFKSLELLLHSEARARRYLTEKSWQNKPRFCVRCRGKKIYRLADKRYRCARCGYTFQEFGGRWIAELNISAAKWLWTLKLFELELTPNRIAEEVGLSYPTVLKATRLIRCAIVQRYLSVKPTTAEAFWHGVLMDALQKVPAFTARKEPTVFSLQKRNGAVVEIAPAQGVSAAALRKNNVAPTSLGQDFYAIPCDKNQVLMFWRRGRLAANRLTLPAARSTSEAGSVEGFLLFAKERFARRPRVSQQHLPLFLMEIKFRYDHRSADLFDLLASAIAQLVPTR
jgi:transposase